MTSVIESDSIKLTRRQRKALGLPKPRGIGAGKIVIPGGKHPKRQGKGWIIVSDDESDGTKLETSDDKEWVLNGTGRVDVRGFKELRI
jgi:OTU domain-containing protein 3